jgi:hypothetical protein
LDDAYGLSADPGGKKFPRNKRPLVAAVGVTYFPSVRRDRGNTELKTLLSDARGQTPEGSKMSADTASLIDYEANVRWFEPEHGLAATNSNDLRRFIYEWFTHFEHAAPVDFYLTHLADRNLEVRFPGADPIASHADFARWYENLLAQTLWNFHDLSGIEIRKTAADQHLVTFVVNWYGEVRADSDQLAAWQSRGDSCLYDYFIRQTWTVTCGDRLLIQRLVAAGGDTPSPMQ